MGLHVVFVTNCAAYYKTYDGGKHLFLARCDPTTVAVFKDRTLAALPCGIKQKRVHKPSPLYTVWITNHLHVRLCAKDVGVAEYFPAVPAFVTLVLRCSIFQYCHSKFCAVSGVGFGHSSIHGVSPLDRYSPI